MLKTAERLPARTEGRALAEPFVGLDFKTATDALRRRGLTRPTGLYVAYAEEDLKQVLSGAAAWVESWSSTKDANLSLRSQVIRGHRHGSGAVPALINGYELLYGNQAD